MQDEEIFDAVRSGDLAGVRRWVEFSDPVQIAKARMPPSCGGWTPLMLAYWLGELEMVRLLRSVGGDKIECDADGYELAWYAQHFGVGRVEQRIAGLLTADPIHDLLGSDAPRRPAASRSRDV